jgi:hypothetical protein
MGGVKMKLMKCKTCGTKTTDMLGHYRRNHPSKMKRKSKKDGCKAESGSKGMSYVRKKLKDLLSEINA